jgi:hypothetical protein
MTESLYQKTSLTKIACSRGMALMLDLLERLCLVRHPSRRSGATVRPTSDPPSRTEQTENANVLSQVARKQTEVVHHEGLDLEMPRDVP